MMLSMWIGRQSACVNGVTVKKQSSILAFTATVFSVFADKDSWRTHATSMDMIEKVIVGR